MKSLATMIKWLVALSAITTTGCTTTPITEQSGKAVEGKAIFKPEWLFRGEDPSKAVVSVFRDKGLLGSPCSADIYFNAQKVTSLGAGEYIKLSLEPGSYFLSVKGPGRGLCMNWDTSQNLLLTAGEYQSYRITTASGSGTIYLTRTK